MIAILHNIRSLHNVGSIFRTADAAGIEKIYLTGYTASPVDRLGKLRASFGKVSLGAEKFVPWEKFAQIDKLVRKMKLSGFTMVALEQSAKSIPYTKLSGNVEKLALVVGNEVRGLSKTVLGKCDKIVEIPMSGHKESLNVGVAFGVVVFNLNSR